MGCFSRLALEKTQGAQRSPVKPSTTQDGRSDFNRAQRLTLSSESTGKTGTSSGPLESEFSSQELRALCSPRLTQGSTGHPCDKGPVVAGTEAHGCAGCAISRAGGRRPGAGPAPVASGVRARDPDEGLRPRLDVARIRHCLLNLLPSCVKPSRISSGVWKEKRLTMPPWPPGPDFVPRRRLCFHFRGSGTARDFWNSQLLLPLLRNTMDSQRLVGGTSVCGPPRRGQPPGVLGAHRLLGAQPGQLSPPLVPLGGRASAYLVAGQLRTPTAAGKDQRLGKGT